MLLIGEDNPTDSSRAGGSGQFKAASLDEFSPAAVGAQADESGDNPTTLSCTSYEVSVTAEIDYIDKSGQFTRRVIRTDEIFDYEDSVLVIRAYCYRRKDYRTFVSKRIQYWRDTTSGELVPVSSLSEYLRRKSDQDPGNVATEIYNLFIHEIHLAIDALVRFSGNTSSLKDRVKGKKRRALLTWIWRQAASLRLLTGLDVASKESAFELLFNLITDTRISRPLYLSSVSVMRKASDARKQALIQFVSESLSGTPEHDSAVSVLKEGILSPSFSIQSSTVKDEVRQSETLTSRDFGDVRIAAANLRKKYKRTKQAKDRSFAYRRYERLFVSQISPISSCVCPSGHTAALFMLCIAVHAAP